MPDWNEAAAYYRTSLESSIATRKSGGMTFFPPELRHPEPLRGKLDRCGPGDGEYEDEPSCKKACK